MDNGDIYCVDCGKRMTTDGIPLCLFYRPVADNPIQAVRRGHVFKCPQCGKTVFGWCGAWMTDEDKIEAQVREMQRNGRPLLETTTN